MENKFKKVHLSKWGSSGSLLPGNETLLVFEQESDNTSFKEWWSKEGSAVFNRFMNSRDNG